MNTVNTEELVRTARTYIGTPFHHAGRLKGVGIDCIGLLVCTAQELGFPIEDTVNYTTADEYALMVSGLSKYCDEIPLSSESGEAIRSGDVLVFRDNRMYNHCAVFVAGQPPTMIHAYNTGAVNRVVEHEIDDNWAKRIAKVFRFREAV